MSTDDETLDELLDRRLLGRLLGGGLLGLGLLRRGGTISLRTGAIQVVFSGETPFTADEAPLRVHIPLVEQSNSSVLIGDKYLLKVFRRLVPGENPDIEVGRTLGARANDARVPSLLAWSMLGRKRAWS